MRFFTIVLIFIFSFKVQALVDFKTCSKTGLRIYYMNGVLTTKDDNTATARRLLRRINSYFILNKIDHKELEVIGIHNKSNTTATGEVRDIQSGLALVRDATEAIDEKLKELLREGYRNTIAPLFFFSAKDFRSKVGSAVNAEIVKFLGDFKILNYENSEIQDARNELRKRTLESFEAGWKVLHVAHSQGGFVVSSIANEIVNGAGAFKPFQDYYAGIFVGSPLSFLPQSRYPGQFNYLNSRQDIIVNTLRYTGVRPLVWNIDVPSFADEDGGPTIEGHSVDNLYFSDTAFSSTTTGVTPEIKTVFGVIKELLKKSVSTLQNNDPACCNKEKGKLWINERDCTGDECKGGFISAKTKYDKSNESNLFLSTESRICGSSQFSLKDKVDIINSSLEVPVFVDGKVKIENTDYSEPSTPSGFQQSKMNGEVILKLGSSSNPGKIIGRPQISGNVDILHTTGGDIIKGSPVISGNVTLTNTIIEEVYPPQKENRRSQINLISFGGVIEVDDSFLKGEITINEATKFKNVAVDGKLRARKVTANNVTIQNDYLENPNRRGAFLDSFTCSTSLVIENSQIGGDPRIDICGSIKSESVIFGNVNLSGRVQIDNSYVLAEPWVQDEVAMKIAGSDGLGIRIENESFIYNRPTIEGDIFIQGAEFNGNGSYKGETQAPVPGTTLRSRLVNAKFSASEDGTQNDIAGFYNISAGVAGSKIGGGYIAPENGFPFRLLTVFSSAQLGEKVEIKGVGDISGTIGSLVKIDGYKVAPGLSGVNVTDDSSFVGAGKSLKGAVVIYDGSSVVNTNMTGSNFNPSNSGIMAVDASTVNDSTLSGIGRVGFNSSVSSSTLTGQNFLVLNAHLDGTTVAGENSYLCNWSYGVQVIPAGFDCTQDNQKKVPDGEALALLRDTWKKSAQIMMTEQ